MKENRPEMWHLKRCRAFKCPPVLSPIRILGEGNVIGQKEGRTQSSDKGQDQVRAHIKVKGRARLLIHIGEAIRNMLLAFGHEQVFFLHMSGKCKKLNYFFCTTNQAFQQSKFTDRKL